MNHNTNIENYVKEKGLVDSPYQCYDDCVRYMDPNTREIHVIDDYETPFKVWIEHNQSHSGTPEERERIQKYIDDYVQKKGLVDSPFQCSQGGIRYMDPDTQEVYIFVENRGEITGKLGNPPVNVRVELKKFLPESQEEAHK